MDDRQISRLVEIVQSNRKYQSITQELIQHLAQDAFHRGLRGKPAVKDVRNKLHQIGGAYFRKKPDYQELKLALKELPHNPKSVQITNYCRETMKIHSSTKERIPILDNFFKTCLAPLAPVTSVLDLACGLNPLAIPWMPLSENCTYFGCDIYLDLLDLVQEFLKHINFKGWAKPCDLISEIPDQKAQVALLLKSIPCLEQVDKSIAKRLLQSIKADHILVSFPVSSLGGQKKGMPDFYREHFYEILKDKNWRVLEFLFDAELAFLVTK
ncbi:MAG: hypothetical protein ACOCYU_08005 [Brevefilum sp.]